MNLLRPWRDIPELEHLAPAVQRRCWYDFERYWRAHAMHAPFSRTFIASLFSLAIAWLLVYEFLVRPVIMDETLARLLMIIVGSVPVMLVRIWTINRWMRSRIRDVLHIDYSGRRFPICIKCGYLLYGCGENVTSCPECGNQEVRGNPTAEMAGRIEKPTDLFKL